MDTEAGDRLLTVKEAYDALDAFGQQAGRLPLLLLMHAAVPPSFRADLLNLLKVNFLAIETGGDLTIDSDVLLSPLVQPVAAGYYRLDPEVRRHCLALLDSVYRLDQIRRTVRVARFLLAYTDALEREAALTLDPLLAEHLAVLRWVSLAFVDPSGAAEAFAGAIAGAIGSEETAALLRLGTVTAAVSIPLAGHQDLLAYARGVEAIRRGDEERGRRLLKWMEDRPYQVGSVTLPKQEIVTRAWPPDDAKQHGRILKPRPVGFLDFVFYPEHAGYMHFDNAAANPFQPNAPDVSRVNAWWLAEAALLAYWSPADAIPIYRRAGFDCTFVSAGGTDCYVASQKDFVVVAFRGTQPGQWQDVLADANFVLVSWKTGRVHLGFKKAFEVIRPQLDPLIQTLAKGRTLWICGHSLGAALATLAADHYAGTRGVCTFGSPRVGDPSFASAFDSKFRQRSLRYVNDYDVVTHVPLPLGYKHVEVRRFIAPDGSVSSGQPAVPHFFTDLIGQPRWLFECIQGLSDGTLHTAPEFLLDHMPMAYAISAWNDYERNG